MKDTIVTAIYHSSYASRMGGRNYTFEFYENPFRNLLSLNANLVVFSHSGEIEKIDHFFKKNNFVDFKILEYDLNNYTHSDQIYKIKEDRGIIDQNGLTEGTCFILNDRNTHLCLSKIYFLSIVLKGNYFESNNYYWADAGLFHNGIIPRSLGGMERYVPIDTEKFWPNNKNNICTPELLSQLREKNNNKLLFLGLTTSYGVPKWWDKITLQTKQAHIVGGLFGGDKQEILKIHNQFQLIIKKIFDLNELTLEEDVLSAIVLENGYNYLKFDTWSHDMPTDSCYYGTASSQTCFYKLFRH